MGEGNLANAYVPARADDATHLPSNYPPGYLPLLDIAGRSFRAWTGLPITMALAGATANPSSLPGAAALRIFLKLPAVLADLTTGLLLFVLLSKRAGPGWAAAVAGIFLIQPGVVYNSSRWGQIDSIHTLAMMLSLELAARRRFLLMGGCAALAVLLKFQSILLTPLWGLCLLLGRDTPDAPAEAPPILSTLREAVSPQRLRHVGAACACAAALTGAICAPFLARGAGWMLWEAYAGAVGKFRVATINAFNLWGVLFPLPSPERNYWVADHASLAGISADTWAAALVAISVIVVVLRIARRPDAPENIRWAAVALCLVFFTFPTRIHERYLHPAVALTGWAFVPRVSWWILWLGVGGVYGLDLLWAFPFEPGWPMAGPLRRLASAQPVGLWPSQAWGLVLTVLTIALLISGPGAWRASGAFREPE